MVFIHDEMVQVVIDLEITRFLDFSITKGSKTIYPHFNNFKYTLNEGYQVKKHTKHKKTCVLKSTYLQIKLPFKKRMEIMSQSIQFFFKKPLW